MERTASERCQQTPEAGKLMDKIDLAEWRKTKSESKEANKKVANLSTEHLKVSEFRDTSYFWRRRCIKRLKTWVLVESFYKELWKPQITPGYISQTLNSPNDYQFTFRRNWPGEALASDLQQAAGRAAALY